MSEKNIKINIKINNKYKIINILFIFDVLYIYENKKKKATKEAFKNRRPEMTCAL